MSLKIPLTAFEKIEEGLSEALEYARGDVRLDIHAMDEAQRAMVAARYVNPLVTVKDAAVDFRVGYWSVKQARAILAHCPPQVIEAVEEGELSLKRAYQYIRSSKPANALPSAYARRKLQREKEPPSERAAIAETNRFTHKQLKEAIEILSTQPLASDVAAIIRPLDRSKFIAKKLSKALGWLREFENVFSDGSSTAAESGKNTGLQPGAVESQR